jgi:hypothetical protein
MTTERRWKVEIFVDEHEDHTRAEARLVVADGPRPRSAEPRGIGEARRRTGQVAIQEIDDELAVSRALWDLAHVLWTAAVTDLEAAVSGTAARA